MNNDGLFLEFLAQTSARLSNGDKWMVRDDTDHLSLSVYQRKFGRARTVTLYDGNDLAVALRVLGGDEE